MEVLWRAVFTEVEFEKFKALVQREGIVETCNGESIYGFGEDLRIGSHSGILARIARISLLPTTTNII